MNKFKNFIFKMKSLDLQKLFIFIFSIILFSFGVTLVFNCVKVSKTLFFIGGHDIFMDYFNISANIINFDPYNNVSPFFPANYPALPYFLMLPFSIINSIDNYISKPFYMQYFPDLVPRVQSFIMPFAIISFILYISLSIYFIVKLINKYLNFDKKTNRIIITLLFFSYPLLFAIERANVMIWSFVFLLFFICYYDSDNKKLKELSLFFLALATGIKFYNAIYIILVFKKGKILPCLKFLLYFLICSLLPFFAFNGGLANIPLCLQNFDNALNNVHLFYEYSFLGHNYSLNSIAVLLGITNNYCFLPVKISTYFLLILGSLTSLVFKQEWKTLFLLTSITVLFPIISYGYIMLLFILPLCSLLKSNEKNIISYISFACMIIIFSPLQFGSINGFSCSPSTANLIRSIAIILSALFMIIYGIIEANKIFKEKSLFIIIKEYFISIKNEILHKNINIK